MQNYKNYFSVSIYMYLCAEPSSFLMQTALVGNEHMTQSCFYFKVKFPQNITSMNIKK